MPSRRSSTRTRANSSRSVVAPGRPLDHVRRQRHGLPAEVLGAEELAAHAAPDGREQIEDGVGTFLTCPLLHDEPRRGQELAEELVAVLPFPAPAPLELPGHRHQARHQDLDEHASHEGVRVRLPQHHADEARRFVAFATTRGAAHVFDQVERGGTRRWLGPAPQHQARQVLVAAGPRAATRGPRVGTGPVRAIRRPSCRSPARVFEEELTMGDTVSPVPPPIAPTAERSTPTRRTGGSALVRPTGP